MNDHINEPSMLMLCSEVVELIEAYEKFHKNYSLRCRERYREKYQHAHKRIRSFNRKTLVN